MGRLSLDITLPELPARGCLAFWGRKLARTATREILDVLSVTGGVPKYLAEMDASLSADENVRRLCFDPDGYLYGDFNRIFDDVFDVTVAAKKRIVTALAEYRLESGHLAVVAACGDRNGNGMDIYRPQGQMGWGSGLYEQYGGTASVSRVMFGENDWGAAAPGTANSEPKRCNDAYGLFELDAGRFVLGKGGFTTGRLWNWDRAQYNIGGTNACYDARLLGGTLAASASSASTVALQLPRADGCLEWDTDAYTNVVVAPVFGEGRLRKTGAGTLALTDATAFRGSVDVEEGTLRLLGSGASAGDDYWQWTADSAAAAGIADGETVSNWYDNVHGVLATNVTFRGWNSGKEVVSSYGAPTLVLNKFNGHAGLKFTSSLLSVPADVNPLANVEKATIVIVVSPAFDGGGEPLTPAQMMALSRDLAQKYGARLYDRDAYHLSDIAAYGLGATNVSVAAGASLSLPVANNSPYTVGAGATLSLYGSVTEGTLALADGATLKMRYGNSPIATIAALRATGNVRLVISDLPQSHPSWIPLASVEGEADIDGARWTIEGLRAAEVSVREGVLGVFSRSGTVVIFR
ncbi:MAG: autotransporter-associated beta strand repeat-containing protein [Kiritimatiellae bacterium]|nr:autotransporter-associated beta strand repeat-containing protein [Kiritimatiellia bacterium]